MSLNLVLISLFVVDPVVMENGIFAWGSEGGEVLHNINLRVKEGSLVAIVGAVGAGKSSLLSAFLGEMEKISGKVNVKVNYIVIIILFHVVSF
jgi:ATP-binding cassette subfamily C (CFTR/MRP) protein 1